jgi:hypothetical protein
MEATNSGISAADYVAHLSEMLENARGHLAELEKALDMERGVLTATPFVVGFPQYNIYCDIRADEWGVVRKVNTNGIRYATRLSREDADRLTRNGNVRNGNGETAVVIGFTDALAKAVQNQREVLEMLQELANAPRA